MPIDPSVFTPQELVVLLVAVGGVVPVVVYRRKVSTWVLLPYAFLFLGAVLTNAEHILWHEQLNYVEHSVGNMGAGLAMLVAAYLGRRRLGAPDDENPGVE